MAWNDQGNGKNPWDRGGDGPPDLDKIVRDWQKRFSALLGGKGGRPSGGSGSSDGPGGAAIAGLAVLVVLGWLATGLYRVNADERGVVLRFGAFTETTSPGLRWHLPWPIESVEKVPVTRVETVRQQTRMLTADENIVVVDLVVQYLERGPGQLSFQRSGPGRDAVRHQRERHPRSRRQESGRLRAARRSRRDCAAHSGGDPGNPRRVRHRHHGQQGQPAGHELPEPGRGGRAGRDQGARGQGAPVAFEAQSYANDILPRARGEAVRRNQDAEAYKARVIADAEGEASRFEQLLAEYERAPGVTRDRLYIDALQEVYGGFQQSAARRRRLGQPAVPADRQTDRDSAGSRAFRRRSRFGRTVAVALPPTGSPQADDLRARRSR